MPALDQTGPQGFGPRTGRGYGFCRSGYDFWPRHISSRGLGRYFGWNGPQTKADRIKDAQTYLTALKEEAEDVEKQLADLQGSA